MDSGWTLLHLILYTYLRDCPSEAKIQKTVLGSPPMLEDSHRVVYTYGI